MGVVERKEREKEEMRGQILSAARKLFLEKGIAATSIRNIAELIEYSPGTIYLHFKDKDAILHALHREGFLALGQQLRPLMQIENALERLVALGRIYIAYALENPDMYDLMFIRDAPMDAICKNNEEEWNEGKATFGLLRQTVGHCLAQGYFAGHDEEALSFAIWAAVHGMVSLEIRQRIDRVSDRPAKQMVADGFEAFVRMLRK